jgi:hypothetical protein
LGGSPAWGWTEQVPAPKKWAGWGYRTIAAKHGWDTADQLATRQALNLPPVENPATTYIYAGPEYPGVAGAVCRRRVVVQTKLTDGTKASEIITSYGDFQGEAP